MPVVMQWRSQYLAGLIAAEWAVGASVKQVGGERDELAQIAI